MAAWNKTAPSGLVLLITSKIRNKLVLAFLVVALVPLVALAIVLHNNSAGALTEQAFSQLDAVRKIKASQIQQYFQVINDQILTFSENRMIVDAMTEFPSALASAREENAVADEDLKSLETALYSYYSGDFAREYAKRNEGGTPPLTEQFRATR